VRVRERKGRIIWLARGRMWARSGAKRTYSSGVVFEYQFYYSFILVAMLDIVVAMPDAVVAIVTAKRLTEKGLPFL
jgi:hypothetical protein